MLDLLGLAARAQDVVSGTDPVRKSVREGKAALVLLAADASPTQQDKLLPLLRARGVPHHVVLSQAELGTAVGRGWVSAVGLTNPQFARRVAELVGAL